MQVQMEPGVPSSACDPTASLPVPPRGQDCVSAEPARHWVPGAGWSLHLTTGNIVLAPGSPRLNVKLAKDREREREGH